MKKSCIILLNFLLIWNIVLSQTSKRIIEGKDSTLELYLSHSIESKRVGDSCYFGMYYLKFSLNRNGDINNYEVSKLMPEAFRSEIKITLNGIKEKWKKGFIKLAAKKNKTIIQPVFLFIDNDCLIDSSLLGKLNFDCILRETTPGLQLKNATMRFLSSNIINIQKTYLEALVFGTESFSYIDCIFLKPCLIIKNIPGKKMKM